MRDVSALGGSDETQDYLMTVGDLMAGLVFVFILTLLIFAIRFQTATGAIQSATDTRTAILLELEERLTKENIVVVIDTLQGVLRLSDSEGNIGFRFARETVLPEHLPKVEILTRVLSEVVPCFVATADIPCTIDDLDRARYASRIHSLQIEGHTDTIPFGARSDSRFISNLELSAARAAYMHTLMLEFEPALSRFLNIEQTPVLGVAGYGAERRLSHLPGDDGRQRRIDLRFIMEPPSDRSPPPVGAIQSRLNEAPRQ